MSSELRFDVLVLGGGGAALRAALSACEQGAKTAILSKGEAGKSGATYYSVAEVGAFNVPDGALDPEDSRRNSTGIWRWPPWVLHSCPYAGFWRNRRRAPCQYLEKISGGTVFAKEVDTSRCIRPAFPPGLAPMWWKTTSSPSFGPSGRRWQEGTHGSQRSAGGGSAERGRDRSAVCTHWMRLVPQ